MLSTGFDLAVSVRTRVANVAVTMMIIWFESYR
jgi:hypothetical protein